MEAISRNNNMAVTKRRPTIDFQYLYMAIMNLKLLNQRLKLLQEPIQYFTTNKEDGWIHVIKKHEKKKIL